ncbi:hypothetical protein OCGS_1295 [Oceaniovalibus guishaninsula JLT2003]|uniref:YjiS-like domain-containing protein n=1 Tax=Oceaniovalibus guishaninsula JLT2003 TaxID=1231392 RepID=K2HCZ5_9RHOB|nr:DUF1127 domain-containing protein [Oceaniovalibus guishaninsula]EKE44457.1 hypothetical protein OCGS_1295 [Oceaniovalibus guishaninsula JLT2003]
MAIYDMHRSTAPALSTTIATGVARFFTSLSDRAAERRTRRALNQLSTHELRDIGLSRDEIDTVARRR